jgi:prophage DNA circulation protein
VQARGAMAALAVEVIAAAKAAGMILPDHLQQAVATAGYYLARIITDMAPLMTVSLPESMPALWWSHRLYGDAGRHLRLASLAGAAHPLFMPMSFEAESA